MGYSHYTSDSQSDQPKEKTGKGFEIPIPKKADFERILKKVTNA